MRMFAMSSQRTHRDGNLACGRGEEASKIAYSSLVREGLRSVLAREGVTGVVGFDNDQNQKPLA